MFVIGQLSLGGAEKQLFLTSRELQESYNMAILSLSSGGYWAEQMKQHGIEVIELQRKRRLEFNRLFKVYRIIKEKDPSIVHIFLDSHSAVYARLALLFLPRPVLIVGERRDPASYPGWLKMLIRLFNCRADAVICNSRSAMQYLLDHKMVIKDRVYYIPNCVDFHPRKNEFKEKPFENKLIIGTVTHLTYEKNPQLFIEAASRIHAIHKSVEFWIIGDGYLMDPCLNLIEKYKLYSSIKLFGERRDISELLQKMDLFVLSSRHEGTPNAVLEAMAAGLPCVVTDVGDAGYLVENYKCGICVPSENLENLANAILEMIYNASKRFEMGRSGYEAVKDNFKPSHISQQFIELYKKTFALKKGKAT